MKIDNNKFRILQKVFFLFVLLFFSSCFKDDAIELIPSTGSIPEVISIEGVLDPIQGSPYEFDDLRVISFVGSKNLTAQGSFSADAIVSDNIQIITFSPRDSEKILYMGLYDPVKKVVTANDTTTALGLAMLNPFLVYADYEHLSEYLETVKNSNKFSQLVQNIRAFHLSNPDGIFDYDLNPGLYQIAFQIMKESMETLGGKGGFQEPGLKTNKPYIEDASNTNVNFVNPRFVWYAAGIYPDNGEIKLVVPINRVEKLMTLQWGFPPLVFSGPETTPYNLGNGYFRIHLANGFSLAKIFDKDAIGMATCYNIGTSAYMIIKLILGTVPFPNFAKITDYIDITPNQAGSFGLALAERDVPELLIVFCDVIGHNALGIGAWMWKESNYQNMDGAVFTASLAKLIGNVAIVFKILGFVNEEAPFFYDLITAPREVTYFVTQQNGKIVSISENNPPDASFVITPNAGIVGTTFTFDASSTIDIQDDFSDLLFRWDFNGDGTWDIGWGKNHVVNHTYEVSGSYNVILEVKDTEGLIGTISHRLNVGGGAGSANRVKLFRDNLPWGSNAMVEMLEALGFTNGVGPNQYQVFSSSQMGTVELIPGEDLVIISNDQNQAFYNNYAANQIRFNNFVYQGGSLFWEACDRGWAEGNMLTAGVILPGNLVASENISDFNYVTNPLLPLVSGLPLEMDHNYASHRNFSNLPAGTTVYCIDDQSLPTLLEFNLGDGWIIVSGQPLEHQYDRIYGAPDMEELLPRIVSYFTGKNFEKGIPRAVGKKPVRPSFMGEK